MAGLLQNDEFDYRNILTFLDEGSRNWPFSRIFSCNPEKDSTPVRSLSFALNSMIEHLRKKLVPASQSLGITLIYKYNGPQRHQGFWKAFKNLIRSLKNFNNDELLTILVTVHKRATAPGAGFYMPTEETMRYLGCAYLKRIFRLQQIRDSCIRTAHLILGQLELGHWERFSLFMIALCADINYGITEQACAMRDAYSLLSEFLTKVDAKFPQSLLEFPHMESLSQRLNSRNGPGCDRVFKLLQLSEERLNAAWIDDEINRFREEVLSQISTVKEKDIDMGVIVNRLDIANELSPKITPTKLVDTLRENNQLTPLKSCSSSQMDSTSHRRSKLTSTDSAIETDLESVFLTQKRMDKKKKKKRQLPTGPQIKGGPTPYSDEPNSVFPSPKIKFKRKQH